VGISSRIVSNNLQALATAAENGLGITMGATLSVGSALLSGELRRVLPDYEFEPSAVFAVFPSARQLSTKVRAIVDLLLEKIQDPPFWDQELAGRVPGL
jgi:DNA-binding transcriptional LysR family regulator